MAMIGRLVIKQRETSGGDVTGKNVNESIGDVICDDIFSEDSTTRIARATEFDTFGRAVANLTTNVYEDGEITVTKSINEALEA